ncbi:Protein FAR1-RELATED SEQUENCE 5 [Abeliophyllum distichum]|uniref:Protein FAR1-RELATED SEQUENCE 5 n=1 Tax=Abeliophyllum distichum TaxID=126358 RepID=A0ABD1QAZ0_9LAMI
MVDSCMGYSNALTLAYLAPILDDRKESGRGGEELRKRKSRKGDDGVVKNVTFTCSRKGRRTNNTSTSLKPQLTIQLGCKARATAVSDASRSWRITKVQLEHNHKTSPSKPTLYQCNRQLSDNVKRKVEVNDIDGIPLHKRYNSVVVEVGGYEQMTFIEKDCRNYIDKARRLRLVEGDAQALQCYFSKIQSQCPGFYFSVDLDEECRLRNVFWADNRCKEAYKEFGDAVTFDTTYLTNRYDMLFAPFVGVNHHSQLTLLRCGLISNEDTQTFTWLFRTWLECMEVDEGPLENSYKTMKYLLREITDWLEMKMTDLNISKNKSSCGNNLISRHSRVHDSTERGLVDKNSSVHMLDPKNSKMKGAPKKLRKKGPLEIGASKMKMIFSSSKEKNVPQSNIHDTSQNFIQAPKSRYPILDLSQATQYQPWLPGYGVNLVPTYGSSEQLNSMYPIVGQPEEQMSSNLIVNPRFHLPHHQYDR